MAIEDCATVVQIGGIPIQKRRGIDLVQVLHHYLKS